MEGKYILGRMGLYFGGESELMLRIWGAKKEYFQGAEEYSFRDLGRSMHYFQGSREHRPPGGGAHFGTPTSLEYSYIVWKPHHNRDIHNLEQVQHRAARFVNRDVHPYDQHHGRIQRWGQGVRTPPPPPGKSQKYRVS